jgi:pimeloyl-ACP methyl ester carboxylesterase
MTEPARAPIDTVGSDVVEVSGVRVSALRADVPRPRAVVVALHGGSANARYFDLPDAPDASLLRTGAALGFTVVALDRPGYGASAPHAAEVASPERRVDLAYAAVDRLLAGRPRGVGVFLVAHSLGCELAVRMAADPRGARLLGLELGGTGTRHHPIAEAIMSGWYADAGGRRPPTGMRRLLWEPPHLYPPGVVGAPVIGSRSPAFESTVVEGWTTRVFPALAARVRVPVRHTLGDHERVWATDAQARAEIAAMFTASPRVVTDEQVAGGHNLSLGHTARAYHLKVLAFAEECAGRNHGD